MNYLDILKKAIQHLDKMDNKVLDILEIKKPEDIEYAKHLAKIVSKISPILGNMIEYIIVQVLNDENWGGLGKWERQDPGFPDTIFNGTIEPKPGIEVKTWFPLATEITARFKDSILHFEKDQTMVAIVAWLPEFLIFGKPKVLDILVVSAKSLALARDKHYHKPPDYLVFEPEDTSNRTANLQQTNTNGYKFQGDTELLKLAKKEMLNWEEGAFEFSPEYEYQSKLKSLLGKYPYRLDTNFAKIDRIDYKPLEDFKSKILASSINNRTIAEWSKIFNKGDDKIKDLLN